MRYVVAAAVFVGIPSWTFLGLMAYNFYQSNLPPSPPLIPGASADEQDGPIIRRGFALGRQYRPTLLQNYGDSWFGATARFEGGKPFDQVKREWSDQIQRTRDRNFRLMVQPSIDLLMPNEGDPTPKQRRNVVLFLRAFAAGIKDRVR